MVLGWTVLVPMGQAFVQSCELTSVMQDKQLSPALRVPLPKQVPPMEQPQTREPAPVPDTATQPENEALVTHAPLPTSQFSHPLAQVHAVQDVARVGDHVPAPQGVHVVGELAYVPAGQLVQEEAPSFPLTLPEAQALQWEAARVENVPARQMLQDVCRYRFWK